MIKITLHISLIYTEKIKHVLAQVIKTFVNWAERTVFIIDNFVVHYKGIEQYNKMAFGLQSLYKV